MQGRLCMGVITGVRGVKGEIRIKPFTDTIAHLTTLGPLESEDGKQQFDLYALKAAKGGVCARVKGVDDRNGAEALKGVKLFVRREKLPQLDEDEFYHADILNAVVMDENQVVLGTLSAIHDFGAGDILEVTRDDAPALLLPFTREIVPEIDIDKARIIVRLPAEIELKDDAQNSS